MKSCSWMFHSNLIFLQNPTEYKIAGMPLVTCFLWLVTKSDFFLKKSLKAILQNLITKYPGKLQFSKFMIIRSWSKQTYIFGMVEKKWYSYFQQLLDLTGLSKKRLVSLQIKVGGDENGVFFSERNISEVVKLWWEKESKKEKIGNKDRSMIWLNDGSGVPRGQSSLKDKSSKQFRKEGSWSMGENETFCARKRITNTSSTVYQKYS